MSTLSEELQVEAVARALAESMRYQKSWEDLPGLARENLRDHARAAIRAYVGPPSAASRLSALEAAVKTAYEEGHSAGWHRAIDDRLPNVMGCWEESNAKKSLDAARKDAER